MQTSAPPRARRAPSQAKPSAAPFSRTAAKLIEQIQAEARAALLEELSAKDAITVLQPLDADTKRMRFDADAVYIRDDRGANVRLFRRREEPECWRDSPHMAGKWHPSHWWGCMVLVDAAGTQWERDLGDMVCDDFGNLVEVPA